VVTARATLYPPIAAWPRCVGHHQGGVVVRASVAVLALLVLSWTAVLVRDQQVGNAASDELLHHAHLAPARAASEMRRLEDARLLDPDTTWDLNRAVAWVSLGRPRRAVRDLESLVRREPANLEAWRVLALISRRIDPARHEQALAELRRLDPKRTP
jgi:predicted Zn-dependent protease